MIQTNGEKLTDEQCDEFRCIPGSFNNMVREIFLAGFNYSEINRKINDEDEQRTERPY